MTAKRSIQEFLDATAAKQPAPGGGSVTALAGALAAAIGEMVLNYSVGKKGLEASRESLEQALHELSRARMLLLGLMAEDQIAFETFTAMRKLPETDTERADKVDAALLACVRVPQAMGATGVAILSVCERVVGMVNRYLLSDLAVCAELAMATVRCAVYNVRVNLAEVTDPEDFRRIEASAAQLTSQGLRLIQSVIPAIWDRHDQARAAAGPV